MAANASRAMPPLQSLLNPPAPDLPASSYRLGHATIPSPIGSDATAGSPSAPEELVTSGSRRQETSSILAKAKPRGPVNYHPFENLQGVALQEVLRFQVTPFGQIHKGYQHIPYSSSKKDLFEKTGRESIEAFKYEFRVHDRVYVVMWDYNIGIVRMNPFIKWGGFPKTKSSQMLDKNPGLRNISPGITGGAVSAQGYWVPYRCARALCATFCHGIAGALIPLFGPSFPSECIPPDAPGYSEMLISRALLAEDTHQAEMNRRYHMSKTLASRNGVTSHPRPEHYSFHDHPEQFGCAAQIHRPNHAIHAEVAWPVNLPIKGYRPHPQPVPNSALGHREYKFTAYHGTRFTPANLPSPGEDPFEYADPYLSAMPPRQVQAQYHWPDAVPEQTWPAKRRRINYSSLQPTKEKTVLQLRSPSRHDVVVEEEKTERSPPRTLGDYNAALALVTLSSKRKDGATPEEVSDPEGTEPSYTPAQRVHPNKRQRARSF